MSKLKVVWTSQFKKDYKAAMKSHLDMDLLDDVIRSLANQEELDPNTRAIPYPETGNRSWNATSGPIGFSSTKSRTTSLS